MESRGCKLANLEKKIHPLFLFAKYLFEEIICCIVAIIHQWDSDDHGLQLDTIHQKP
jgi:hypothetical protein